VKLLKPSSVIETVEAVGSGQLTAIPQTSDETKAQLIIIEGRRVPNYIFEGMRSYARELRREQTHGLPTPMALTPIPR